MSSRHHTTLGASRKWNVAIYLSKMEWNYTWLAFLPGLGQIVCDPCLALRPQSAPLDQWWHSVRGTSYSVVSSLSSTCITATYTAPEAQLITKQSLHEPMQNHWKNKSWIGGFHKRSPKITKLNKKSSKMFYLISFIVTFGDMSWLRQHSLYSLVHESRQGFFSHVGGKK